MKKAIVLLAIIISVLVINKEEKVIIPKDSIRFRIIASSNSLEDQKLKKEILKEIKTNLEMPTNITNIKNAREFYKQELPSYRQIVEKTLNNNHFNKNYSINYGKNYFPKKVYKNIVYEAGEYESLVITIGDGLGKNFWCVLFPPLCLIDEEQEEYPSLVKTIVNKYF